MREAATSLPARPQTEHRACVRSMSEDASEPQRMT